MSGRTCIWMLGGVLALASVSADDNTEIVVSGITTNMIGPAYIGNAGTNNSLVVTNAGVLITTNGAMIGYQATAQRNRARVTGSGSVWSNPSVLFTGLSGSRNRLEILAGGRYAGGSHVYVGYDAAAVGNEVLADGNGSLVSVTGRTIYVGYGATSSRLTATNQGVIDAGTVILGNHAQATSNQAEVVGSGSVLQVGNNLTCGSSGSWSRVEIRGGGRMMDAFGTVGWYTTATHNVALVDGIGSSWSNRNRMYVGRWGSFNQLVVTNGGCVYSGDEAHIGEQSNGVGNVAIVAGTGSVWVVSNMFYVGSQGPSNRLEIRAGATVSNGWNAYVGDAGTSYSNTHGNSALVTGTNSHWTIHDSLFVGRMSGWNRLELLDGAMLSDSNAYVGWGTSPYPSNLVDVSGLGTVWTNSGELYIAGPGNLLTVSNGATVYTRDFRAGGGVPGMPSRIILSGTNAQWFAPGRAIAGLSSSHGEIVVTNGGRLFTGGGMIGQDSQDSNNVITVTGSGSVWSNSGSLQVGYSGSGNLLAVEAGGRVVSAGAGVGAYTGGNRNRARVSGTQSVWRCGGVLLVGDSHYNELLVEFGGAFSCTSAVVGRGTSNQVTVTGAGSVFSNAGALVVGAGTFAAGCGFTVSNAAFAHSDRATVAEGHGSSNFVVVTGPGSVWSNAGWLSFGLTGKWNRLTVESGGFLHSGSAAIGVSTSAVGNVATVTGSTWSNAGPLQVGVGGPGNVLLVQAGGRVAAGSIVVGTSNTARGCRIDLQGGTVFAATSLVVNTNAALVGAGTVTVSSAFDNYGTVSVGAPVGQLVVNGVFLQRASGALDLQLGGRQAGSTYDQLFCTMNFGLGGTLRVSRLAGFVPTNSERFQVVAFPNSTGSAFAGVELPPWFSWAVDYSPNTGVFIRVTGVDTATNGVPKAWLVDHGWSTNFDAAALADTDGDHVAAWAEYHAGTDPTNGLSYLGVQSVRTNAGIVIQWPGAADKRYRLERGTNLVAGFGQALKTNIPGVPPMNAETDTTAVGAGPWLYRILIE